MSGHGQSFLLLTRATRIQGRNVVLRGEGLLVFKRFNELFFGWLVKRHVLPLVLSALILIFLSLFLLVPPPLVNLRLSQTCSLGHSDAGFLRPIRVPRVFFQEVLHLVWILAVSLLLLGLHFHSAVTLEGVLSVVR